MTVPIPGFPGYRISDCGDVSRNGKTLRPCVLKRGGYLAVSLWRDGKGYTRTLNRLVALSFIGPPPTPLHHAAHNDGNKAHNTISNIAWKTKRENEADKIAHGTTNRGERNGMSKITDAQAAEIVRRAAAGESRPLLCKEYGLTSSAVSNIVNGRRRAAATA